MSQIRLMLLSRNNALTSFRCIAAVGANTSPVRSMNAWVCDEYKKPLVCRQISVPEVKKQNQILVKVEVRSNLNYIFNLF